MSDLINNLKKLPIRKNQNFPAQDYLVRKSYYHNQVISQLPVLPNNPWFGEKLQSCQDFGLLIKNYYWEQAVRFDPEVVEKYLHQEIFLRTSVLKDLQLVDEKIKPYGLRLMIFSGYRHPELQRHILHQVSKLKGADFANKMFADPDVYAPHATGAVFDLVIWDEKIQQILPAKIPNVIDRYFLEEKQNLTLSEIEVRDNRRLLHNLLTTDCFLPAGREFVGHPYEYWHYGRFERLSSFFQGSGHPIYFEIVL